MAFEGLDGMVSLVMLAMMAAIVWSLKYLVVLERKLTRIDLNIDKIARQILAEEKKIQAEEKKIEAMLTKRVKKK